MTGPEHYRRAQEFMAVVTQETHYGKAVIADPDLAVIAAAQVHAILALAAATAHAGITLTLPDGSDLAADWNRVIFSEEGVA